jgi:16S rRNA (uracil1498-N3)-methyltransferase
MIFLFHNKAGENHISLEGDTFKHMIKARRQQVGDTLLLKKLDTNTNYFYTIESSTKKDALLVLKNSEEAIAQNVPYLHIGWCMIDPKSIEKVLPSLCEMGLSEISFIYANRSQKNFSLDKKRVERILMNSMQQSGRYFPLTINYDVALDTFITSNSNCVVLDFCDKALGNDEEFDAVLLGPEGGFDDAEKLLVSKLQVRRLNTPLVLKSESAALAITSKMLL